MYTLFDIKENPTVGRRNELDKKVQKMLKERERQKEGVLSAELSSQPSVPAQINSKNLEQAIAGLESVRQSFCKR